MIAQAFGIHTDNAYFSANSSLGQVIIHKILPLDGLSSEGLRTKIETFASMLKRWREGYANGEIYGMTDEPAGEVAEMLHNSLRA